MEYSQLGSRFLITNFALYCLLEVWNIVYHAFSVFVETDIHKKNRDWSSPPLPSVTFFTSTRKTETGPPLPFPPSRFLHRTILYYTVLYCTILYYTVLYCTILYYTVLPVSSFLSQSPKVYLLRDAHGRDEDECRHTL